MKFNYQLTHSRKQQLILLFSEFFFFIFDLIINYFKIIKLKNKLENLFVQKTRLTILANGPSLENDIKNLSIENEIFAVNTFPANDNFIKFKPKFLCWIDTMFSVDVNNLSEPLKYSILKTYEELNKIDWKLNLFVPSSSVKKITSRLSNKNISIISIPSLKYDYESSFYIKLLSFLNLPPPRINVLVTSIYLSLISGVKEIEIFGADMDRIHSFEVDKKTNTFQMKYNHFSNSENNKVTFIDKLKNRKPSSMYIKLKREASSFKWLAYTAMLADNLNILLKNKSSKSLIDSIDR